MAPATGFVNPWCPLHFERVPGGQVSDSTYDQEAADPLTDGPDPYLGVSLDDVSSCFASPVECRAFRLAVQAHRAPLQQRISLAEQALQLSPHCAEAYNLLAVHKAADFEEALGLYRKGAELGPKAYQQQRWKAQVAKHELHDVPPYRLVLLSAYGVANTLRKMRRWQEALVAFELVWKYQSKEHMRHTYCNLLAYYPEVLIRAKGPAAALEWMDNWKGTSDYFISGACAHIWTAAYVLCLAATEQGEYVYVNDQTILGDMSVSNYKRGTGIALLVSLQELVALLLGDKLLPAGRIGNIVGNFNSCSAAVLAAVALKDLWEAVPGALAHLRRYRATQAVISLCCKLRCGKSADVAKLQRLLDEGIYADAVTICTDGLAKSLLELFVFQQCATRDPQYSPVELQALQALLAAGCPVVRPPAAQQYPCPPGTLLTYSAYQGHGPKVTEQLLQAGADPAEYPALGRHTLEAAANQGNWRELHVLLRDCPDLLQRLATPAKEPYPGCVYRPATVLEYVMTVAFTSCCHGCIETKRRQPCPRCSGCSQHAATANFYSTVDVLVAHGAQLTSRLLQHLQEFVAEGVALGTGEPYVKLLKHLEQVAAAGVTIEQVEQRMAAQVPVLERAGSGGGGGGSGGGSSSGGRRAIQAANRIMAAPAAAAVSNHHQHNSSCSSGCSHSHGVASPQQQQQQQQQQSTADGGPPVVPGEVGSSTITPAGPAATTTSSRAQVLQQGVEEVTAKLAAAKLRPKACWGCSTREGKLCRCAGCGVAQFCSKECQKEHWAGHKADCKAWKALQAVGGGA